MAISIVKLYSIVISLVFDYNYTITWIYLAYIYSHMGATKPTQNSIGAACCFFETGKPLTMANRPLLVEKDTIPFLNSVTFQ